MLVVVFVGRSFIPNGNLYRVLKNSNAYSSTSSSSSSRCFSFSHSLTSPPPPPPSSPLPPPPHLPPFVLSFLNSVSLSHPFVCIFARSLFLFRSRTLFLVSCLALSHPCIPSPPANSISMLSIHLTPHHTPFLINNLQVSIWLGSTHSTKH